MVCSHMTFPASLNINSTILFLISANNSVMITPDDVTGLQLSCSVCFTVIFLNHLMSSRALTLASPEVRFHMDSETHDPIDLQTKELKYAFYLLVNSE